MPTLFNQTARLKRCAKEIHDGSSDTYDLDQLVEVMKGETPQRWHCTSVDRAGAAVNDNTLSQRVFFNQPRSVVPMAGFIVPYVAVQI